MSVEKVQRTQIRKSCYNLRQNRKVNFVLYKEHRVWLSHLLFLGEAEYTKAASTMCFRH